MKKENLYVFVAIALMLFLGSCEGGTTFTKTLDNRSSEDITVKLYTHFGESSPVTVNSNEKKEIYWDDRMGHFVDETYTCTQIIDSVAIRVTNDKVLVIDFLDPANWTRESRDGRNAREDCTFVVTDEHLETGSDGGG
ncbi:MAG: hypothetical protein V2I46_02295 [Bacteroides sp.]|jgi:hypothetical protein|nr:hypothetical protein [Bacteroides sp.]